MGKVIKYIKSELVDFILGRVYVTIKTWQFENNKPAYLLKQKGWIYLHNYKFIPDYENGGNHVVQFRSMKEIEEAVIWGNKSQ